MALKTKRAAGISVRDDRHNYDSDSDCKIVKVTSRKRKMKKPQQPSRQAKTNNTKPHTRRNSVQKRGARSASTPVSAANTTSAARSSASSSSTSKASTARSARPPPITPIRIKTVECVDLTQLLSSSDESDDSDDEDTGPETIDSHIFKGAGSQKGIPRFFRERGQPRDQVGSPSRATKPVTLTVSSDDESDSEAEREKSPSIRYSRGRLTTPTRAPVCFRRSKSPSPEEQLEDRRRNVRASTAPPPALSHLYISTQQEQEAPRSQVHPKSTKSLDTRPWKGLSNPSSTDKRTRARQNTSSRETKPFPLSVKCEPPHRPKSTKVVKDAQSTATSRPSISLLPARKPPFESLSNPTKQSAVAASKIPVKSIGSKPSPATTVPAPPETTREKARAPIKPSVKDGHHSKVVNADHQLESNRDQHSSLSGRAEDQAWLEARPLPPAQSYRCSRAMRPTVDRLKEGIRSGRVTVPPVKEKLRVTPSGRRAISAEMERRGITSSASYNEFRADLMREYSRLLYRSQVPHLSMMTFLMNELQDECLEIEARRPAPERTTRVLIKKEQSSAMDLKTLFPESKDSSDSSDTSSDSSDDYTSDESSGESVGTSGPRIDVLKTEDLKPVIVKKEPLPSVGMNSLGLRTPATTPNAKRPHIREQSLPHNSQHCPTPSSKKTFIPSQLKSPDPPRLVEMVSRGTQTLDSDLTPSKKKRSFEETENTAQLSSKRHQGRTRDDSRRSGSGRRAAFSTSRNRKIAMTPCATPRSGKQSKTVRWNSMKKMSKCR